MRREKQGLIAVAAIYLIIFFVAFLIKDVNFIGPRKRTIQENIQLLEARRQVLLESPEPLTPEEQQELLRGLLRTEEELAELRAEQIRILEVQSTAALLTSLVVVGTFIVTNLYQFWKERRDRTEHALEVKMKELEIEKLRREVEDSQQNNEKLPPPLLPTPPKRKN